MALEELQQIWSGLEPQARDVLIDIARRLRAGQATYGTMDVDGDGRDYFAEAAEEAMDFVVYAAMARLRERRQRERFTVCSCRECTANR